MDWAFLSDVEVQGSEVSAGLLLMFALEELCLKCRVGRTDIALVPVPLVDDGITGPLGLSLVDGGIVDHVTFDPAMLASLVSAGSSGRSSRTFHFGFYECEVRKSVRSERSGWNILGWRCRGLVGTRLWRGRYRARSH